MVAPTGTSENARPQFKLCLAPRPDTALWGPTTIPDHLLEVPYTPFSKADPVGRAADWTKSGSGAGDDYGRESRRRRFDNAQASAFAYYHTNEDDGSFSLVDRSSKPSSQTKTLSRNTRNQPRSGTGRGGQRRGGARKRFNPYEKRARDPSCEVGEDWHLIEEVNFNVLGKLGFDIDEQGPVNDVAAYGTLFYYDKTFDRFTTRQERPLQQVDRAYYNPTSSEDPILNKLADSMEGPVVIATDSILSALMCMTRSVLPWDLVFKKSGQKLTIDKREGVLDYVTVGETIHENAWENIKEASKSVGTEEINAMEALALEATYVWRNFAGMCVKESEQYALPEPDPFHDPSTSEDPASSAMYRYRTWSLGDSITLLARTTIDAALTGPSSSVAAPLLPKESTHSSNETQFITVRAVTEFDSKVFGGVDWRSKLDAARGAVIATEMKNNSFRMGRWCCEALLSGSEALRIGFVSRSNPRNQTSHSVLGTSSFKPRELATQMNLNVRNGWGILKVFVDMLLNAEDGKYVLVKDPNAQKVRLYQVPDNWDEEGDLDEDVESEM